MSRDTPNYLASRPNWQCHVGRHDWEGATSPGPDARRRCRRCLKTQIGSYDGISPSWQTRTVHNSVWCAKCGNELVTCPNTACKPIKGGACRYQYECARCGHTPVFDFGLAPVAIPVED